MLLIRINQRVPSLNTIYKKNRHSVYKSQKAKDFTAVIRQLQCEPYSGSVRLDIVFVYTNPLVDIDNGLKLLLDSLEGVAYINDRQIVELNVKKLIGNNEVIVRCFPVGFPVKTAESRQTK